jgi:hypothetical protein
MMNSFLTYEFIFSPRYHVWRHIVYWVIDILIWTTFWTLTIHTFWHNLFKMAVWMPVFLMYSYPLVYWVVPKILLKGKFIRFALIILFWGILGWYINKFYRLYVFIPAQLAMHFPNVVQNSSEPAGYLCITTTTSGIVIFAIFKQWIQKQQQWMQAQQEKVTAELQLLKAQVHPHFLFNTLNNIYSFSLENSPKTPQLILKLSSLLSYMLYDCKSEEVRLEKEVEIMKNYIELEKERYADKIDISWSIEGELKDQFIAPLLILPFLENAFKHGASEQIEKPWLGVDLSLTNGILKCKITNSKNEYAEHRTTGIGIHNVQKRLALLYPGRHDLKIKDEGDFFVVSLMIKLAVPEAVYTMSIAPPAVSQSISV